MLHSHSPAFTLHASTPCALSRLGTAASGNKGVTYTKQIRPLRWDAMLTCHSVAETAAPRSPLHTCFQAMVSRGKLGVRQAKLGRRAHDATSPRAYHSSEPTYRHGQAHACLHSRICQKQRGLMHRRLGKGYGQVLAATCVYHNAKRLCRCAADLVTSGALDRSRKPLFSTPVFSSISAPIWKLLRNRCFHKLKQQRGLPWAAASSASYYEPEEESSSFLEAIQKMVRTNVLALVSGVVTWFSRYGEILRRLSVTLLLLVVLRSGHFIALPGVDMAAMPVDGVNSEGERIVRALSGHASELPASLFYLGIGPFINASILLSIILALPDHTFAGMGLLAKLKEAKKEGKQGEAHLNFFLNLSAGAIAVYCGIVRASELSSYSSGSAGFMAGTTLALVVGACIVQFCATTISHHGVGNGSTLVICSGIVLDFAGTFSSVFKQHHTSVLTLNQTACIFAGFLVAAFFITLLHSTEVRLPLMQLSNRSDEEHSDTFSSARATLMASMARKVGKRNEYYPIPLNSLGIMPIVFASVMYYGGLPFLASWLRWPALMTWVTALHSSLFGFLIYGFFVFVLEFIPLGSSSPKDISDYLSSMKLGIKGVVPGATTEHYLKAKMTDVKLWGGLALATVAVCAKVFDLTVEAMLGTNVSTTSLLIIVGGVLQSARQMEALLEGPRLQQLLDKEKSAMPTSAFPRIAGGFV